LRKSLCISPIAPSHFKLHEHLFILKLFVFMLQMRSPFL
jgi:hypothetical protein